MARPSTANREPLASIQQVAEYLGLSVQTLYNWRAQHRGPKSSRAGGRVRYRWADVEAWHEQQST